MSEEVKRCPQGTAIPMSVYSMTRPEPGHEDNRWPSPPDPGDLSRRIAQRRADLHLSQVQVASRARLSLRYLEYLERYPGRPAPAALRQLAAALRTTPAALLGAGANVPPSQDRLAGLHFISKLMPDECRRLIAPGGVGRIAFGTPTGPVVVPVNFAVLADAIVVRTAEGTVIDGRADEQVALEVDHIDEALCQGWSVLVRGPAHRVTHPAELRHLQEDAVVWSWAGGEREVYVRIVPREVSGRRIELRSEH
jgi:nitroimidazol reductase NimA-like FMN-containing flavoprotein (pyridoxamine 5'-phosphate oxidase superfamily)